MVLIQMTIALPAYGIEVPVNTIMIGVGVLLFMLGNVLPKSRPGFFVGIRTPWAIMDENNWIATHRLGGKLMMLAGAVIVLASVLPLGPELVGMIVLVAALSAGLIPFVYSWWLWSNRSQPSD